MQATFTYTDFDGSTKTSTAQIFEVRDGFYAQNLETFGRGKTMSPAIHWKPIRAAITDLLGGRTLISYTVI